MAIVSLQSFKSVSVKGPIRALMFGHSRKRTFEENDVTNGESKTEMIKEWRTIVLVDVGLHIHFVAQHGFALS